MEAAAAAEAGEMILGTMIQEAHLLHMTMEHLGERPRPTLGLSQHQIKDGDRVSGLALLEVQQRDI